MSSRARTSLVILVFLSYISLGLPDAVNGVAWPAVRQTFDQPISALWALLATSTVGYLLASFTSAAVVNRVGVGWVLSGSSALIVLGMAGYALSPTWAVMAAFGLLAGMGGGSIDAAMNVYAATHFRPKLVTWMHACWGIGATVGPLLMTFAIATMRQGEGDGWRWGYAALGAVIAVMLVGFLSTLKRWDDNGVAASGGSVSVADAVTAHHDMPVGAQPPASDIVSDPSAQPSPGLWDVLWRWKVWSGIVVFFLYTGLEAAVGAWTPSLLAEGRGFGEAAAGTAVAIYWASLTGGRLVIGSFANRVSVASILLVSTIAAPLAIALLWLSSSYAVNVVGLAILGFALAPMYPLWITQTPIRLGKAMATHAIGFQVSSAYLGMTLIPATMGFMIRWMGFEVTGPALFAVAMAVLVVGEIARRQTPREGDGVVPTAGTSEEG